MIASNPSRSGSFVFTVSGKRVFTLSVQNTNVANVELGVTEFPTRAKDGSLPSNKTSHDDLVVQFLVSEDLREWIELYKWILVMKNNNDSHIEDVEPCQLMLLDSQNRPVVELSYRNCWPFSLDGMQYTSIEGNDIVTSTATFKFDFFEIKTASGEIIDESYGKRGIT